MTGNETVLILLLGGLLGFIAGCLLIDLLYVSPARQQIEIHRARLIKAQEILISQIPQPDYEQLALEGARIMLMAGNDDWSKKAELRSVK